MSAWRVVGIIPVVGFLVLFQVAMFAANGFWAGFWWLAFQLFVIGIWLMNVSSKRALQRQQLHTEIAARADYEHHAICRGDLARGFYGRFQPTKL